MTVTDAPVPEPVLVARDGDIATVTLNRPEKLNALNLAAWRRLGEVFAELGGDESVRCIVVRGAGGKAFGAGADIAEFEKERRDVEQAVHYGAVVEKALTAVAENIHPTIALIEGACVGGGLELACACDLRICGASSRFGIPVNRLGLTMAYAELRALLDVVGSAVAKEILFSGEIFDAFRAVELGLVTRIVGDDRVEEEAYELAKRIAAAAPLVNRWHKKFIRRLADPSPLSEAEVREGYAAFGTEDFRCGYRAFLDKKTPEFEGD